MKDLRREAAALKEVVAGLTLENRLLKKSMSVISRLVKRVTGKEQFVCTSFGGMLADIAWIGQYDSVG